MKSWSESVLSWLSLLISTSSLICFSLRYAILELFILTKTQNILNKTQDWTKQSKILKICVVELVTTWYNVNKQLTRKPRFRHYHQQWQRYSSASIKSITLDRSAIYWKKLEQNKSINISAVSYTHLDVYKRQDICE